jgi:hypothetical protein
VTVLPGIFGSSLRIEDAKLLEPNFNSAASFPEKTASIRLASPDLTTAYRTKFLFDYDIFPRNIMRAVIIQRVFVPPGFVWNLRSAFWPYSKGKPELGSAMRHCVVISKKEFPNFISKNERADYSLRFILIRNPATGWQSSSALLQCSTKNGARNMPFAM